MSSAFQTLSLRDVGKVTDAQKDEATKLKAEANNAFTSELLAIA
jgi:hypothetical protein